MFIFYRIPLSWVALLVLAAFVFGVFVGANGL